MDSIVIGKDEISRIIMALRSRPVFGTIRDKLFVLANGLGVPYDANEVSTRLILKLTSLEQELMNVLTEWQGKKGNDATVGELVKVMKRIELNDFVQTLETEFEERTGGGDGNGEGSSDGAPYQPSTGEGVVYLDFGEVDIKHSVLSRIQPELVTILYNKNVNIMVILQLEALGIFDSMEISPVRDGSFSSEQDRVIKLLQVIRSRESSQVKLCLEKLCNLDNLTERRKQVRDCIHKNFNGSVKYKS